jgi:hypothetical protein
MDRGIHWSRIWSFRGDDGNARVEFVNPGQVGEQVVEMLRLLRGRRAPLGPDPQHGAWQPQVEGLRLFLLLGSGGGHVEFRAVDFACRGLEMDRMGSA